jgi:hypothetical protein
MLAKMLTYYDPRAQQFLGDENFRKVTHQNQKRHALAYFRGEKGRVSINNFKVVKTSTRISPSRLCGELAKFQQHTKNMIRKTFVGNCEMCGNSKGWKCGVCNRWMCMGAGGRGCHIALPLHNNSLFGLARCDNLDVHGPPLKEWRPPTDVGMRRNIRWIERLFLTK